MKLTRHTMNSRLARRMVLGFVVAALLPIVILAWLSFQQVSHELMKQGGTQARKTAKSIGMDVFERLSFLSSELDRFAYRVRQGEPLALPESIAGEALVIHPSISGLFSLDLDGQLTNLIGQIPFDGRQLIQTIHHDRKPGRKMLLTLSSREGGSTNTLLMLRPLDQSVPGTALLGIRIDADSLWDHPQLKSRPELICILSEINVPIYCNRPPPDTWISSIVQHKKLKQEQFLWQEKNQQGLLSAFWSLFLEPHFQVNEWTIGTGIPTSEAMAPIDTFQRTFAQVMLLTLVFVAILSIRSVRRSLDPLGRLLQATRQLANGDFGARARLDSGGELQELGESFDQMASQLGQHFKQQTSVTNVSRRLQRCTAPVEALKVCLDALPTLIEIDRLGAICRRDNEANQAFWVWPLQSAGLFNAAAESPVTDFENLPTSVWSGSSTQLAQRFPAFSVLNAQPHDHVCLVPALSEGRTLAILILASSGSLDQSAEQLSLLQQLGELLAIALTSVFLQHRLRHQAYHDPLTDLPNRLFLQRQVDEIMMQVSGPDASMALMIIDIDRFKMVNDSMGHVAGDDLLIQVSRRLQYHLGSREILSRFAGDEFVLILSNLGPDTSTSGIDGIIARLDLAFDLPFVLGNRKIRISASKGIALYPRDGHDFLTLLKSADAAMYQAKKRKSGGSAFYSSIIQSSLEERIETEQDLILAVKNQEFVLHYQPGMSMDGETIIGAEALVRWQHPEKGLLMPGQFIEVAEETGLIEAIGMWTLRKACQDFVQWRTEGLELDYVAVNLSGLQLQNPQITLQIKDILLTTGMDPRWLELEVTETALIEDFEASLARLKALRALGLRIAIDDFGTGYASLKYLKTLPADKLKIDRLFVKDLPGNLHDEAIISALVTLAGKLQLVLLAEGIETAAQQELLLQSGVKYAQGYYFSRPLPLQEFKEFARRIRCNCPEQLQSFVCAIS